MRRGLCQGEWLEWWLGDGMMSVMAARRACSRCTSHKTDRERDKLTSRATIANRATWSRASGFIASASKYHKLTSFKTERRADCDFQ
jgi:hypothetical protein